LLQMVTLLESSPAGALKVAQQHPLSALELLLVMLGSRRQSVPCLRTHHRAVWHHLIGPNATSSMICVLPASMVNVMMLRVQEFASNFLFLMLVHVNMKQILTLIPFDRCWL